MKHNLNVDKTGLERGARGSFDFPVMGSRGANIKNYEGEQFVCHFHPEAELTVICEGEMYYRAHDTEYLLRAGDAVFVNANVMHAGRSCNGMSCYYLPINFWPLFISGHDESLIDRKYVSPLLREELLPCVVMRRECAADKEMLCAVDELVELVRDRGDGWELLAKAVLCRLWYYFYTRKRSSGEEHTVVGAEAVKRAISFIEAHYTEKLTLADLATAAHLSRSEFCRVFRRFTGRTPFSYLQYHRVRRSLPLLQDRKCSILEISEQMGFAGASYYAEVFRRFMGCAPLEYRKKFL